MWQDQNVTPVAETQDDVPRLAEIARTLSDFRSEFRDAVSGMVRRDVYIAEMRTLEVKIEGLVQECKRLERDLVEETKRLDTEIERDRGERRTIRNQIVGVGLTALLSIVLLVLQAVVQ